MLLEGVKEKVHRDYENKENQNKIAVGSVFICEYQNIIVEKCRLNKK